MGILSGLVGITADCDGATKWGSLVIGIISSFVYLLSSKLLVLKKIDDPLDASALHMGCGLWGLMSVGIFDKNLGFLHGKKFTHFLV